VKYLLDSDLIAAAVKGRLPVVLKLQQLKPSDIAVSVLGQAEAETALRLQPRAQARYGKLLKEFLQSVHVLEVGTAEAQQAVVIGAYLQAAGVAAFAAVPNLDVERWA
jgi:tRNA(fMet)-specific endonuclease VapC